MMNMFNKLFEKPVGLIALFYLIVFLSVLGLGLYYITNNNAVVQNGLPPKLTDTLGVVKELPVVEPMISAAVDMSKVFDADQATLDKGKQIYTTVCSSCHGPEGKGDGPAGAALNPKPRNFHAVDGWKNGRKFSEVYFTLQKGILTSGMPAYDYMPANDRVAIISFIRTFMTDAPVDSPDELAKLDQTYGLSAGTKVPGQIPLAAAATLLVNDKSAQEAKINIAFQKLSDPANQTQFALFTSVAENYRSALTSVLNTPESLENVQNFQSVVFANAGRNGFNASVLRLSNAELTTLYTLLKTVLS